MKDEEAIYAIKAIARAITDGAPNGDVGCLTSAVMALTRSMEHIAEALRAIATAIEHH